MKIKSKVIIVGVVALLLLFFGILIYHSITTNNNASVKFPEEYTVITSDNAYNNEEFLEQLGFEPAAFTTYLNKNDIVYFAATIDNSRQFKVVSKQTQLSSEVVSLEETSEKGLETIGEQLLNNNYEEIEYIKNIPYFKISTEVNEETGSYVSVQYITIRGGKYYQITYYGTGSILSNDERLEIAEVMNNLKIPSGKSAYEKIKSMSTITIVYVIIISLVIIFGIIAIALLAVSIIKDLKIKYKTREDTFKIKRRK